LPLTAAQSPTKRTTMNDNFARLAKSGLFTSAILGGLAGLGVGVAIILALKIAAGWIVPAKSDTAANSIEWCLAGFPTDTNTDARGVAITNRNGELVYCALFRVTVDGWSARK
jgi:hypothetical protein